MLSKKTIIKVLKASDFVEEEVRKEGLTPYDFSQDEWVEMIQDVFDSKW